METNIEILSWTKSRNECGFRLNLINHIDVFVRDYGTKFVINENKEELFLNVIEYSDEKDYSTTPATITGKDLSHIDSCEIIGNKKNIKLFQKILGYSSIKNDASESQRFNNLCEAIDNLRHSISMLEYEFQNLKEVSH